MSPRNAYSRQTAWSYLPRNNMHATITNAVSTHVSRAVTYSVCDTITNTISTHVSRAVTYMTQSQTQCPLTSAVTYSVYDTITNTMSTYVSSNLQCLWHNHKHNVHLRHQSSNLQRTWHNHWCQHYVLSQYHHSVCGIIINTNNVYSQYHYSVRDRVCTHTITINTNNVYSQ